MEWLIEIIKSRLELLNFWRRVFDERYKFPSEYRHKKGLPDREKKTPSVQVEDNVFGAPRQFDPFNVKSLWSRKKELERFNKHLQKCEKFHLILAGPSGSGKTVFLNEIIKPQYGERFIGIAVYNKFLDDLVRNIPCPETYDAEKHDIADRIKDRLKNAKSRPITEAFGNKFPDEGLVVLVKNAQNFIERALAEYSAGDDSEKLILFVFDQIERFLSNIKFYVAHSSDDVVANEIYCLIQVLKTLRKIPNARTIFVIRQDILFESIDFLTYSLDEPSKADCVLKYMYFYGINSEDPAAIRDVDTQFNNAKITSIFPVGDLRAFLSLDSRSAANTFSIQLTGYMLENFYGTDDVQQELFFDKTGQLKSDVTPRNLLPLFFDELIAGFRRKYPITISYDMLRVVMLTIAIENKATGNPISNRKIALLAHVPKSYVETAAKYLEDIGVLVPDFVNDGTKNEKAVRFAHDILFDHILESEKFFVQDGIRMNAELRVNVERLSERRAKETNLTPVDRFGHVWDDAINSIKCKYCEPGAIAVAFFIVYGAVISLTAWDPNFGGFHTAIVCETIRTGWFNFWSWSHWPFSVHVDTCDQMKWYYPVVYIMDSAWVSFIYKLDRGYFQHVLHERRCLAYFSRALPILGVFLGVATRFTPVFILVPLLVVGLIMAYLLIRVKIPHWGWRTFWNMIFAAFLIPIHWFMVTDVTVYKAARHAIDITLQYYPSTYLTPITGIIFDALTVKNITFLLTGGSLLWFLIHIRPEQQSEVSHAARLAAYDAKRSKGS